jgi:tripartite-type tricarboxylate transporter receptor subunit TctC
MKRRAFLALGPILAAAPFDGQAQPAPSRPLTVLVGGAAGSVPDLLARALAERLAPLHGQSVVVENRAGAAGAIAMAALVRSAPDGNTVALATMSQAVFNSYLFPRLPYDPLRDLEPVTPLATGAMVLAAHPSFAGASLADYVAMAKSQGARLFVAMPQTGSPPHVVALLLNRSVGVNVTMVSHKSGAEALHAVLTGEVPLLIEAPTSVAPLVQAGKLKALAVTGRQREPLLPQTPTAREAGLNFEGEAWIGLVAPPATPAGLVDRLNREVVQAVQSPDMQSVLARLSFRSMTSSPEDFRRLIQAEHAKWGPAIREAGLRLE